MLLVDAAAAKAAKGGQDLDDDECSEASDTLAALSLTCRAFKVPAQKLLLASVMLEVNGSDMEDFVSTFAKRADLCDYIRSLVLLVSDYPESPVRWVKGFQAVFKTLNLETVIVEGDNCMGDGSDTVSTFVRQLLDTLRFRNLHMRYFEVHHTVFLPSKSFQSLTLDFSTIDSDSFAAYSDPYDEHFGSNPSKKSTKEGGANRAVTVKELYIRNLVCAQLHPVENFGSIRSGGDPDLLDHRYGYEEEATAHEAVDILNQEEVEALRGLFQTAVLGKPANIYFENCRISHQAAKAIFSSPTFQDVEMLSLHQIVQCATDNEFGVIHPVSLARLGKLKELRIGAVDKDLFRSCPYGLQKLSMLYINASLGVIHRLLDLDSRAAKLDNRPRQKTWRKGKAEGKKADFDCLITLTSDLCEVLADGPLNTIEPERLATPYIQRHLSSLDEQLASLGHYPDQMDLSEAAEFALEMYAQKIGRLRCKPVFLWPVVDDDGLEMPFSDDGVYNEGKSRKKGRRAYKDGSETECSY